MNQQTKRNYRGHEIEQQGDKFRVTKNGQQVGQPHDSAEDAQKSIDEASQGGGTQNQSR